MNRNINEDENFNETEWTPPTEAELKVLEARRERNNKISSLMGQYLLKGYKMLAITCTHCDCILLEDKQKKKYCIACSEVDADTKKDNPAVSEYAARRTVEESQHRQSNDAEEKQVIVPKRTAASASNAEVVVCLPKSSSTEDLTPNRTRHCSYKASDLNPSHGSVSYPLVDSRDGPRLSEVVEDTLMTLKDKLTCTTNQLRQTSNIPRCMNLVKFISETAIAIKSLQDLK